MEKQSGWLSHVSRSLVPIDTRGGKTLRHLNPLKVSTKRFLSFGLLMALLGHVGGASDKTPRWGKKALRRPKA
jgi:hypothetical protein